LQKVVADAPKLADSYALKNSLLELYGLVSIIDPHVFGDITSFKEQYVRGVNESLRNLKAKRAHQTILPADTSQASA
jgi:hypothetical protein